MKHQVPIHGLLHILPEGKLHINIVMEKGLVALLVGKTARVTTATGMKNMTGTAQMHLPLMVAWAQLMNTVACALYMHRQQLQRHGQHILHYHAPVLQDGKTHRENHAIGTNMLLIFVSTPMMVAWAQPMKTVVHV